MTMTRLALAGLLLLAGTTVAGAADVRLHTKALTEVTRVNAKGETETRLEEAARVAPGDEVIYAIHWENAGPNPAESVVITNAIPRHMACLTVEEAASARATLSVDGGATFGPLARLTVAVPGGTPRPATFRDCTHVRWYFDKPVAPGHRGTLHFRATLL